MERADLLYSGLMFAAGMLSALDRAAAHCHLRCARALAPKIRTHRCYNFIYKNIGLTIMVPKNLRPLVPYLKRYRGGLALGRALRLIQ